MFRNAVQRLPSSFRDPEGHVFFEEGKLKRKIMTHAGRERMKCLLESDFYQTHLSSDVISTSWSGEELIHETVPVVTYPYEWSFDMLKEAALCQLTILEACIQNNFILKDGSAFNTLFHKGKMVFVDLLSIDTYQGGQIWEGYHQFCKHFLFPLLLQASNGLSFQPFWRGTLDGISLKDMRVLLNWRSLFSPAGFKHVFLQNALSSSVKKTTQSPSSITFSKQALLSFVHNLKQTVQGLHDKRKSSVWENYVSDNTYQTNDQQQKENFIQEHLAPLKPHQLIDLGCNTGHYSKLVTHFAQQVISVDYDPACIDVLYGVIKQDGTLQKSITPMVGNLVNPSPALGWDLNERENQLTRFQSDAFLALALIHHVCITENVPLDMFVAFLKQMGPYGVVEWVDKKDPMVHILLKNRRDIFQEYTWEHFQNCLQRYFKIEKVTPLNQGTRKLCFVTSP